MASCFGQRGRACRKTTMVESRICLGTASGKMPPSAHDTVMAIGLADRIVRLKSGRVHAVFMIGSRALGRATSSSDLDLVVLIETDARERPWGGQEALAQANRIQRLIGTPPIRTDLTVRSVDQFEEAKGTIGGVEYLVVKEGFRVFSSPLKRKPTPRLPHAVVRRALAYAWLGGALKALSDAARADSVGLRAKDTTPERSGDLKNSARLVGVLLPTSNGAQQISLLPPLGGSAGRSLRIRAAQKAVTAICVAHQVDTSKQEKFESVFRKLQPFEPKFTTAWKPRLTSGEFACASVTEMIAEIVEIVISREGTHPCLAGLIQRLKSLAVSTASAKSEPHPAMRSINM